MRLAIVFLCLIFVCACRLTPEDTDLLQLSDVHQVHFLDSVDASLAIIQDEQTNFFEEISVVDMCIQLKKTYDKSINREKLLTSYKAYLQSDVENFTLEEVKLIKKKFRKVFRLIKKNNEHLFPKDIKLIKTKAKHYGQGTFYTRNNCIVIPNGALADQAFEDEGDMNSLFAILIHEVAHIITRYNKSLAIALYKTIGFSPITDSLYIPDSLKEIILLNPDGVNYRYAISIVENTDTLLAIPLIRANSNFEADKKYFFKLFTI